MMFAPKLNEMNQILGGSRGPFRSRFQGLGCCCGKAVGKGISPKFHFFLPGPAIGTCAQIPACSEKTDFPGAIFSILLLARLFRPAETPADFPR